MAELSKAAERKPKVFISYSRDDLEFAGEPQITDVPSHAGLK